MNLERDSAPTGFYDYLPRGTIRRKAFTRKNGTKVRAKMVRDMGAPGKWRARHMYAPGIGKLKSGDLKAVGYDVTSSVTRRHKAVKRAVAKYGRSSTIKKLNAVAVYTRRTSPAKSKKFKADMKFAQKAGMMKPASPKVVALEALKSKISEALTAVTHNKDVLDALVKEAKDLGVDVTDGMSLDDLYGAVKKELSAVKK